MVTSSTVSSLLGETTVCSGLFNVGGGSAVFKSTSLSVIWLLMSEAESIKVKEKQLVKYFVCNFHLLIMSITASN